MEGVLERAAVEGKTMPTLSGNTGTGARYFLKKKRYKVVLLTESLLSTPPILAPCRKPDELRIDSMVSKGRERVVLFCSLVTSSPMEAVNWEVQGRPLGRLNPQLDALSYDTEAKLRNYCDLSQWRISSGKQISNRMAK